MLSYNNLHAAWLQVKSKQSAGGIDKRSVTDFANNETVNLQRIERKLKDKTYLPEAYLQIKINKDNNEKRTLGLATINDKIVQTAIKNLIESRLETGFLNSSYAYREGRSARKAVNKVRHYIQAEKKQWLAKCDIDNFFDNLDHQRLKRQLTPYINDNYLLELIFSFIKMGYITGENRWIERLKGVPQGAVLSPLLANLYLSPLDQRMKDLNLAYVRYADDFVMLADTQKKAEEILQSTILYIEKRLKLQLNSGAFVKHTQYGFKFLGVWITDKTISISSRKIEKIKSKIKRAFLHHNFPVKYYETVTGINNYYGRLIPQHILYPIDEFIIKLWENKILKNKDLIRKKHLKKALKDLYFVTDIYNQNKNFHVENLVNDLYEQKNAQKVTTAEQAVKMRRKIYEKKAGEHTHLHVEGYGISLGIRKKHISIKEHGKKTVKFPTYNLKHITIASNATSISTRLIKYCADHDISIDFTNNKGMPYAKLYHYQSTHDQLWLKQMEHIQEVYVFEVANEVAIAKINNQLKLVKYFSKYAKHTENDIALQLPHTLQNLKQILKQLKNLRNTDDFRNVIMGLEGAASAQYWQWFRLMVDEETDFEHRITQGASDLVNSMLNYGYSILYKTVWSSVIHYGLHPELGYLHAYQKGRGTLIFDLIEPFRQSVVDHAVLTLINRKTHLQSVKGKLDGKTKQKLIQSVYDRLSRYDKYMGERIRMIDIIDKQTHQLKLHISHPQDIKFIAYKTIKW